MQCHRLTSGTFSFPAGKAAARFGRWQEHESCRSLSRGPSQPRDAHVLGLDIAQLNLLSPRVRFALQLQGRSCTPAPAEHNMHLVERKITHGRTVATCNSQAGAPPLAGLLQKITQAAVESGGAPGGRPTGDSEAKQRAAFRSPSLGGLD
jgi:hypothetical protein